MDKDDEVFRREGKSSLEKAAGLPASHVAEDALCCSLVVNGMLKMFPRHRKRS